MNPDADDDLRQLAEVFARHAPPEPSDEAWGRTLARVEAGLRRPPLPRWPWAAAAAVLLALGAGYALWPPRTGPAVARLPAEDDNDEPFAVASAAEVHVLSVGIEDADRLALGRPLLGALVFASHGEIQIDDAEPHPDDGVTPTMQANATMPLIVGTPEEP